MTDIKKLGKVAIVGGGRNAGKTESKMLAVLEELEQYRAIGTVEELQAMKENGAFSGVELAQIAAMQMKLKKYMEIGTLEEFKALKHFESNYEHNLNVEYNKAVYEFAEEYNNGWIPCERELPQKDMWCLATFESGNIDKIQYLVTNNWGWNGEMGDNRVVAWQPLPEPYQKGE